MPINTIIAQNDGPIIKTTPANKPADNAGQASSIYSININRGEYGDGKTEGRSLITEDMFITSTNNIIEKIEFVVDLTVKKEASEGDMKDVPAGKYKAIFNYNPEAKTLKIKREIWAGDNYSVLIREQESPKPEENELKTFKRAINTSINKCGNIDLKNALSEELKKIKIDFFKAYLFNARQT